MSDRIRVDVRHVNDQTAIIEFNGTINRAMEDPIRAAHRRVTGDKIRHIIFQFQEGQYFDTVSISILIKVFSDAFKQRQELSMALPNSHAQKIFRLLGISHYANIYDTLDDALSGIEKTQ